MIGCYYARLYGCFTGIPHFVQIGRDKRFGRLYSELTKTGTALAHLTALPRLLLIRHLGRRGKLKYSNLLWLLPLLVLAGCVSPEAAGIRRQQSHINYGDDVKIGSSIRAYGFRSQPTRGRPEVEVQSEKAPGEAAQCLQKQLQTRLRLPDNFIQVRSYTNSAYTVALHNPFTNKDGVLMDVRQRGVKSSVIKLYANGTTLSRVWRGIPAACK